MVFLSVARAHTLPSLASSARKLKACERLCFWRQCAKTGQAVSHHAHRTTPMTKLLNTLQQASCPRQCVRGHWSVKPQGLTACLGARSFHLRGVSCYRYHVAPLAFLTRFASDVLCVCMSLLHLPQFHMLLSSSRTLHIDIMCDPHGEVFCLWSALVYAGTTQTVDQAPQCSERSWTRRWLGLCKRKRLSLKPIGRTEFA